MSSSSDGGGGSFSSSPPPREKRRTRTSPRTSPLRTGARGDGNRNNKHTGAPPLLVLSGAYLDRHSGKNDLVKRLRAATDALSDDSVEPGSSAHPGLPSLCDALVHDRYLHHPDKSVRLHTTLACMEVFYLYAPEPPWDETEILAVFDQTVRQLANLAHCVGPTQPLCDTISVSSWARSPIDFGSSANQFLDKSRCLTDGTDRSEGSVQISFRLRSMCVSKLKIGIIARRARRCPFPFVGCCVSCARGMLTCWR